MSARQAGFTLIEVMITVFIAAVGLLSVAGLQALSKKSNFDAIQRTQAAALGQDLIERMRANPGRGADYLTDASNGISSASLPATPATACTVGSSGGTPRCTPAQVVAFDLYEWSRALFGDVERVGDSAAGGLSEPTACITNASAPCGVYTVAIAWRASRRCRRPIRTIAATRPTIPAAPATAPTTIRRRPAPIAACGASSCCAR